MARNYSEYIDKVYSSNNPIYGDYKIIEILGIVNRHRMVNIQFLNNNNIQEARLDHVINGDIRDHMYGINFNKDYVSKRNGKFRIVKVLPNKNKSRYALIRFNDTGYCREARIDHILTGNVIDYSVPQNHRIGWYGNIDDKHSDARHWFTVWSSMLNRCYNNTNSNYRSYGKKGVTVCERWHCFENFYHDLKHLPGYNEAKDNALNYHLDKDYLQRHLPMDQRVYSPETCMLLTKDDNMRLHGGDNDYQLTGKYTINPITILPPLKPMVKIVKNNTNN